MIHGNQKWALIFFLQSDDWVRLVSLFGKVDSLGMAGDEEMRSLRKKVLED